MSKIYKYSIYTITILTLILLVGVSCKSKKISIVDSDGELKAKSHNEILGDILSHELKYNTITTKGNITLKGMKVPTTFKIIKDSILQASVRIPIIGAEIARVDITPQKIVIIDRNNKTYAETYFDEADTSSMTAFNFYNLQALLTDQLFITGKKSITKQDYSLFDISTENDKYVLATNDANTLFYQFYANANNRITSVVIKYMPKNITLKWDYDLFVEDKDFVYPTSLKANLKMDKKEIGVDISYSALSINTNLNVDTEISSKYRKIGMMELIGTYIKTE